MGVLLKQQLGEERLQGSPNGAIEIATGPGKADKLACFLVEGVRLASVGGPWCRFQAPEVLEEDRVGRLASPYKRISVPEEISNLLEEQGMVLASGYTSGDWFQTPSMEQHFGARQGSHD